MVNAQFNKILGKIEKKKSSIFTYKTKGPFGQPNTHIHTHTHKHTHAISHLYTNLQVTNFQRQDGAFTCLIHIGQVVHVSGIYCHVLASLSGYVFVYKLELDLQQDNFIELLAVQHGKLTNEDLMELEAQKRTERDKRKK